MPPTEPPNDVPFAPRHEIRHEIRHASPDVDSPRRADSAPPALRSETLLAGARVRVIEHAGERYQLRLTRNGRLLLSK